MAEKKSGVFYYGSSMLRTFTPGETLILEEREFSALVPGDVIAVFSSSKAEPGVIHRVIRTDGTAAVTMGDNNPLPDDKTVTVQSSFMICTGAVSLSGKYRRISGGRAGMFKFRVNRLRRFIRLLAAPAARKAFKLMFWRIQLREAGRFSDGSICYNFGKYFVARRTASGLVHYRRESCKLLFKLPDKMETVR